MIMDTIEVMVIENNGSVVDMIPTEELEEFGGMDECPLDYDTATPYLFPMDIWSAGDIGFRNYQKHIVKS